jgi:hypothetical protein
VRLEGEVRADPRAPGGVELAIRGIEILGPSVEFPITPKEHGTPFLLDHRHLWLRSRRQVAIMKVRHEIIQGIRDFFHERGFVLVDTPILTGSIGESGGTLFETEYFDLGKADLAQTGQLYVEAACAAHLSGLIAHRDYARVMIQTAPDQAGSASARVRELRRDYEARFRQLIDALTLPPGIDPRHVRLLLFGALNWSQVWYNPGGDPPEVVARRFIDTLRLPLQINA